MKKTCLIILFLTALVIQGAWAESAQHPEFVTGKDWVNYMTEREKFISLIPPALLFSEFDVNLKLSLPQYILLIDKIMERNPKLEDEEVSSIFASTIYLFEPQNRDALRTMEMNFLRGDVEAKPYHNPRLSLEDVLKEIAE